ncbi:MAG: MotA/TolQ/ExbB proton channel family protein [Verrucomicrobiota bacterium JB022]|nr:MotA/TolQ/ExbB proton channel family protein [Verrucomicrobiota bacterium JB022]
MKMSRNTISGLVLGLVCLSGTAFGQSSAWQQAHEKAETKLESSLGQLAELQTQIKDEKLPLARERQALLDELKTIRREADRVQRLRDNSRTDVASLEQNVQTRREEMDYLANLTAEYSRSLETRADAAEVPGYQPLFDASLAAMENPSFTSVDKIGAQLDTVGAGIDRVEKLLGGTRIQGQAVAPNGTLVDGTFVLYGPLTFFASSDGAIAGEAARGQSDQPTVLAVGKGAFDGQIASVASSGAGLLPTDATLGNAAAVASTKESLLDHVKKGGVWVWPIIGFAVLSLIVALFKSFELFSLPKPKPTLTYEILAALHDGKTEEANRIANSVQGPPGKLLQTGVKNYHRDPELLEEMLYETIVETQPKVMRLLPFISVTAAVSPLLGLLGTVTGMINTFNMIKIFGTGDAKSLSGGISEALITTEFGLIVAIPAVLFYALLSRYAKGYLSTMENMAISFGNGVKALRTDKKATVA